MLLVSIGRLLNRAEYVVHIDHLDPATLVERLLAFEADRERVPAQVERVISEFGTTLAVQRDLAFRELRKAHA